ncbi:MAG: DUF3800 domain-containing protein [Candidatus Woesearchaeota archaeon]
MTKYIFIDESGNLGFSKGSSKYLIITALIVEDTRPLKRIIKKLRTKKFKKELHTANEIKAVSSSDLLREVFLQEITNIENYEVHYIYVNKRKINNFKLKLNSNYFYDLVASELAKNLIFENENLEIIIDNSKDSPYKRSEFNKRFIEKLYINSKINNISISHKDSFSVEGLQCVDLISWSIFQKYESNDNKYYIKIKSINSFSF